MATTAEIASEEKGRDHGLVRAMGVFAFAAAITNEVVGSGIYRLPASMATAAGTAAPYAYLACLVAMGAIVLCFSVAGSRVSTSGGPYGYVEAAFGKMPGFVAGVLLWLSSVLACGGVAAALADTAGSAFPIFAQPGVRQVLIVGVLGAMAGINIIGVDLAAKVLGWATVIKVLPLLLFLVVGAVGLAMGHSASTPITHAPNANFGRAAILAMFALTGMETPLAASGEVRDPARTVPRALLLAMGSIGLLYIAIQLVADALLGAGLMNSGAPLADALGTLDARWRAPLLVGAFFSMLIWLGSDFLGAPRVLFAFARDGMLPSVLGKVHPRWKTPYWGIIVHFLLAAGLALTGTFEKLAILSTLAIAPLYFLACASAVMLQRRGIATLGKPLSLPGVPFIAGFGMICMIVLVALAEWSEIVALAGVLIGSSLLYLVMRPRT
ncbi:MAG: amino acid permease [Rhizorhabdus sp.]|nr:amino acid permease [Rhizorhabdus sp.]